LHLRRLLHSSRRNLRRGGAFALKQAVTSLQPEAGGDGVSWADDAGFRIANTNRHGITMHQERAMSPLSTTTRLAAAAMVLALSGCYYPYGYYPYGANGYYSTVPASATQTAVPVNASGEPVGALNQHDPIPAPPPPSVTTSGSYSVPAISTQPVAASQQVYVPAPAPAYPAYYPYPAYPAYYGYGYGYPAYWGPSVSIGFWGGGCCWGGHWGGGWGGGWHGHYH
jgi:hypothetical protein